jgi:ABC-type Fe3+-siderophore transport system permease subunit
MAQKVKKITRGDLETKFREIQDDVQGRVESKKSTLKTAAIAGGVVMLLLVYILGRRSGRKKTTLVEIRRL